MWLAGLGTEGKDFQRVNVAANARNGPGYDALSCIDKVKPLIPISLGSLLCIKAPPRHKDRDGPLEERKKNQKNI